MKYFLLVLIIFIFGSVGYYQKYKIIMKKKVIDDLLDYINFYESNLAVFRVNLTEINNKYLIMQNNKIANKCYFILKNNNTYIINYNFLNKYIFNISEYCLIISYLNNIGKSNYENEKKKNDEMKNVLKSASVKYAEDVKNKGEVYFKILLAVGAVVSILIW